MKWLIYGGNGWIGKQLRAYLAENSPQDVVVVAQARADNELAVQMELSEVRPDVVFSCVGRTHGPGFSTIDYLEQDGKLVENVRDNLFSPLVLGKLCENENIYFVYLGTGCIFESQTEGETFSEFDKPNFFGSGYSVVKGFTDRLFGTLFPNSLNLRIRMPITGKPGPRNFITKITTYEKVINIQNSMSVLPTLFPAMTKMIASKTRGTVNLTNPGTISHNEILDMYTDIVDPSFHYQNFTLEEQDHILASKRSNNGLDTTRLKTLCPDVPDIQTAVRQALEEYKNLVNNETILLTGGCGFIGSNMVKYLYDTYPHTKIINLDKLTYCGDVENVEKYIREDTYRYKFVHGDVCDADLLRSLFTTHQIDCVFHFAAETHVDRSFDSSLQFTRSNVLGTHTLLQTVLHHGQNLKRFVHISTDEVYGDADYKEQVKETNKTNPTNPYAATKAGAESLVNSYQYSFGLPCVIIRGNNVYGPRQFPEKLIPKFTLQAFQKQAMTVHGNGETRRSFIHVDDVVRAVDTVRHKGALHEIYNIGIDEEYTVNQVAAMITAHLGASVEGNTVQVEDRKFNDQRYYISNEKLRALGWAPTIKFEDGLPSTMDWFTERASHWIPKM